MKVPDLVQNVYRDLRDRRMLSIAVALIGAIILVPFLASAGGGDDSSSTAATTAPPTAPFAGDEQLDPVVLAEVPGLRDFRERLLLDDLVKNAVEQSLVVELEVLRRQAFAHRDHVAKRNGLAVNGSHHSVGRGVFGPGGCGRYGEEGAE